MSADRGQVMRGLIWIPTLEQLAAAYGEFQRPQGEVGVENLALWSQWSRLDPRLAEQWVTHCAQHWRQIPSGALQEALHKQPWPAAAGVLLEQVFMVGGLAPSERKAARAWMASVLVGIEPASGCEQFFIGTRAFAGKAMLADVSLATHPYLKWGYLGRELLVNKASRFEESGVPLGQSGQRSRKTWIGQAQRQAVLAELMREKNRFRIVDYENALQGGVSRRQAEKDLQAHPSLKSFGRTKARWYARKA